MNLKYIKFDGVGLGVCSSCDEVAKLYEYEEEIICMECLQDFGREVVE